MEAKASHSTRTTLVELGDVGRHLGDHGVLEQVLTRGPVVGAVGDRLPRVPAVGGVQKWGIQGLTTVIRSQFRIGGLR